MKEKTEHKMIVLRRSDLDLLEREDALVHIF